MGVSDNPEDALPVGRDGLTLALHRCQPANTGRPAVLLTHGGNTNSHIYLEPEGGLAGYLYARGWDPWLLDWRGSSLVVDPLVRNHKPPIGGSPESEREVFTLDRVAEEDVPAALSKIRATIGPDIPISVVAYCLSSGAVSMAIARGVLEELKVRHFVLLSLGLFFEVPWNGWIKAEDYILERTLIEAPYQRVIDPKHPEAWPPAMQLAYERLPKSWLPPPLTAWDDMLRRLSFMIGPAWATEKLHFSLRGDVRHFFGGFHMGLYLHAAQNVRRGYAARFDSSEARSPNAKRKTLGKPDLQPQHFQGKHVRIICAQNNGVWHRNASDLMFDWLGTNTRAHRTKHVARGYNLHELLWGEKARDEVYPQIEVGLDRGQLGP